jgi:hypothetical protein
MHIKMMNQTIDSKLKYMLYTTNINIQNNGLKANWDAWLQNVMTKDIKINYYLYKKSVNN